VDTTCHTEVQVGSVVRIRSLQPPGPRFGQVQVGGDDGGLEHVVTIVASDSDMGLWRLSPRTPLGNALLGHRPGDRVTVRLRDVSAEYEVVSISPDLPTRAASELRPGMAFRYDAGGRRRDR